MADARLFQLQQALNQYGEALYKINKEEKARQSIQLLLDKKEQQLKELAENRTREGESESASMGEEGEGLRFQELKNAFDELEMKAKENQQFFEEMRERQKEEQRAQKEASSKLLEAKERELAILQSENEEMELELGRLIEKVNQQANQVSTIPSSPFIVFLAFYFSEFNMFIFFPHLVLCWNRWYFHGSSSTCRGGHRGSRVRSPHGQIEGEGGIYSTTARGCMAT